MHAASIGSYVQAVADEGYRRSDSLSQFTSPAGFELFGNALDVRKAKKKNSRHSATTSYISTVFCRLLVRASSRKLIWHTLCFQCTGNLVIEGCLRLASVNSGYKAQFLPIL
jgi:hypothetical protein